MHISVVQGHIQERKSALDSSEAGLEDEVEQWGLGQSDGEGLEARYDK